MYFKTDRWITRTQAAACLGKSKRQLERLHLAKRGPQCEIREGKAMYRYRDVMSYDLDQAQLFATVVKIRECFNQYEKEKRLMGSTETSESLGVSLRTLQRLRTPGFEKGPTSVKIRRRYFYFKENVLYFKQRRIQNKDTWLDKSYRPWRSNF